MLAQYRRLLPRTQWAQIRVGDSYTGKERGQFPLLGAPPREENAEGASRPGLHRCSSTHPF